MRLGIGRKIFFLAMVTLGAIAIVKALGLTQTNSSGQICLTSQQRFALEQINFANRSPEWLTRTFHLSAGDTYTIRAESQRTMGFTMFGTRSPQNISPRVYRQAYNQAVKNLLLSKTIIIEGNTPPLAICRPAEWRDTGIDLAAR